MTTKTVELKIELLSFDNILDAVIYARRNDCVIYLGEIDYKAIEDTSEGSEEYLVATKRQAAVVGSMYNEASEIHDYNEVLLEAIREHSQEIYALQKLL